MLLLELGSASIWRKEDVDVDADEEGEDGLEWPFRSRTGVPDVLYVCVCVCCRRTSGHTMLSYQRLVYRLGCSRKIAGGLGGTHRIPTPGGRWWRGVDDGRPGHQVSCTEVRHLRRTRSRWRQGHPRLVPCCLAWVREADVVFSEARTGVIVLGD